MIYNIRFSFCQSPAVLKGIHIIYLISNVSFKQTVQKCLFSGLNEYTSFWFAPIKNTIPEVQAHLPNSTVNISNPHFQILGTFQEMRLRCIISLRPVLRLIQMCAPGVSLHSRHHL